MAVYFNDLTVVKNDPQQNCRLLPEFWKVVKKIQEVTNKREKHVFACPANVDKPDEGMAVLQDSVNASGNWDLINTYASCFVKPFQERGAQDLLEKIDEHTGGEAEYSITIAGGRPIECKMLGWAHYVDAITVGLASAQFWIKSATHPIQRTIIEDDQEITESVESICVTNIDQIKSKAICDWVNEGYEENDENVTMPERCMLSPKEKHLKIQMHDGRDVMLDFAERLNRNCYVQGVVDSIGFESTTSRFISKCYPDGRIDLRLHWTKKGFGVQVQTTARGLPQTRLVANELRRKYDRCS